MKPLLIILPAPARWPALQDLLQHEGPPLCADLERRVALGVSGAEDVVAALGSGGQFLACAGISKRGDIGVLGHGFVRPAHRGRGYARQLTETVMAWFDMTGGKWLYLSATAEVDEGLYRRFGFRPLHRSSWAPYDRVTMVRASPGAPSDPLADLTGECTISDLTRADWPAMVALLQHRPGPDPRVPIGETAVTAEVFALDIIAHQEKGTCQLKGAFQGPRLVALATVATDQPGHRTYAMLLPHSGAPAELRAAVTELAASRGYAQVDFPMEALASPR